MFPGSFSRLYCGLSTTLQVDSINLDFADYFDVCSVKRFVDVKSQSPHEGEISDLEFRGPAFLGPTEMNL